jgi:hypothetical protein
LEKGGRELTLALLLALEFATKEVAKITAFYGALDIHVRLPLNRSVPFCLAYLKRWELEAMVAQVVSDYGFTDRPEPNTGNR